MLKTLASYIGDAKKYAIATPLLVLAEVMVDVSIPFMISRLINDGIEAGDLAAIQYNGLILLFLAALALAFGASAGYTAAEGSSLYAKNLRTALFSRVLGFSFENIDSFSRASLITRLTTDVTRVQNAFQMLTRMAIRSPGLLVFAMIMAFRMSGMLAFVFVFLLPVLGFGFYMISSRVHPLFHKVFKSYDLLNNTVQENVRAVRVVKSFVREDFEKKRFQKASQNIYDHFSHAEKLLSWTSPLMQGSTYAALLAIFFFGGRAIVDGQMHTGELVALITYSTQIMMSLMMLSMMFVMLIASRASAERISEVLMTEDTLVSPENPVEEVPVGDILFDNVSFAYQKDSPYALKNINLAINKGETVGILGGTGSGKTTLVSLIPRLYDATEGTVYVGGRDVKSYDLERLRAACRMVLQKNVLFYGTVRDNLKWGDETASDDLLWRALEIAQADVFVKQEGGLDAMVAQGGTNFSGGQKQRLTIARALLGNPRILILDDSTSAVDTKTDARIRANLRDTLPETTKLIIAQRIASIIDADRIVLMEDGEIAAVGTHEELLATNQTYRDMVEHQQKGGDDDEE